MHDTLRSNDRSVKRIEFWVAIITLLTTIIGGAFATIGQFKPVKENVIQKPFEGIWNFSIDYDHFHGRAGKWSARGEALITWRSSEQRYKIYFGADVFETGASAPELTGFSEGFIAADRDGWPAKPFTIENIRYIARMHRDGKQPSALTYEYRGCTYDAVGGRGDTISGKFETKDAGGAVQTRGTVQFKWKLPLH